MYTTISAHRSSIPTDVAHPALPPLCRLWRLAQGQYLLRSGDKFLSVCCCSSSCPVFLCRSPRLLSPPGLIASAAAHQTHQDCHPPISADPALTTVRGRWGASGMPSWTRRANPSGTCSAKSTRKTTNLICKSRNLRCKYYLPK